jgi:Trp operon repressor
MPVWAIYRPKIGDISPNATMPHVSRKKIPLKIWQTIWKDLVGKVSVARHPKETRALLGGLLTKTEKVMLAKRLAAIILISRGYSPYEVSQILCMSDSTTKRFSAGVDLKKFSELIAFVEKQRGSFWESVEQLLRVGLPPYGKGRWRRMHTTYE